MHMPESVNVDALLKRNLVWDTLPCPSVAEMMPKMGLIPGSESGNDREHKDSHRRLNRLVPIQEAIALTAPLAGEVLGRAILESQGKPVSGIEDPEIQQYIKVVHAGTLAVLANLVDMGAVRLNTGDNSGFLG